MDIGKNIEDGVEKHLLSRYIPYYRNISGGCNGSTAFEIDFIIPGGIVEVKSQKFDHYTYGAIKKLIYQIYRLFEVISKNDILWIFLDDTKADINNVKKILGDELELKKGQMGRLQIVSNLYEIKPLEFSFVLDYKYLATLVSDDNKQYNNDSIFMKDRVYTKKDTYDKLTLFTTDEELARLEKFNIKFIENTKLPFYTVKCERELCGKPFTKDMFNKFKWGKDIHSLGTKPREPRKHDDRFTKICKHCNAICIKKHKTCHKCDNEC